MGRIIAISGSWSSVGKTELICRLIPYLPNLVAVKVTACGSGACPRHSPCGACDSRKSDPELITDRPTLRQPGTDTDRYFAAGAKRVIWAKATPARLAAVPALLEKSGVLPSDNILIEGNGIVAHIRPDALVLLCDDRQMQLKPSAERLLQFSPLLVGNVISGSGHWPTPPALLLNLAPDSPHDDGVGTLAAKLGLTLGAR